MEVEDKWEEMKVERKKRSTGNTLMGLSEVKEIIQMLRDMNLD